MLMPWINMTGNPMGQHDVSQSIKQLGHLLGSVLHDGRPRDHPPELWPDSHEIKSSRKPWGHPAPMPRIIRDPIDQSADRVEAAQRVAFIGVGYPHRWVRYPRGPNCPYLQVDSSLDTVQLVVVFCHLKWEWAHPQGHLKLQTVFWELTSGFCIGILRLQPSWLYRNNLTFR